MKPIQLFISHASQDKSSFVRPLAAALEAVGFRVWLDEVSLKIGDSIWKGISDGLRDSDFGVVVLSPSFMTESKTWPGNELDGMFAIESAAKKYILPIWLDVDFEKVKGYAPLLAGRVAALGSSGIPNIVRGLQIAVETSEVTKGFMTTQSTASRLKNLAEELRGSARAEQMFNSTEGRENFRDYVKLLFSSVQTVVEEIKNTDDTFGIRHKESDSDNLHFSGNGRLNFVLSFTNSVINSLQGAYLRMYITQSSRDFDRSNFRTLLCEEYLPVFLPNGSPLWESVQSKLKLTNEQLQDHFMNEVVEKVTLVAKERN